eukprot:CAMPEP_0173090744 /NCGR_PEP_ID=MMETSP1102-20130122/27227_1 /TAXON_ID=49646 /ORGANISM="Geminigera sp., Strain Caron Lab Isolate" /LENGTH=349 /DNA_ID=CAMNT_0013975927 /DNA_START=13 /DNA_END=1062 /DNA_ORIENTATION=+
MATRRSLRVVLGRLRVGPTYGAPSFQQAGGSRAASGGAMPGLMQDHPLVVSGLLDYAVKVHGDREIVSRTIEDPSKIHRYTYADAGTRTLKLANALARLGVGVGDRVATIAWNGYRHLELYYAISGSGAVLHTINPRLAPEQLGYVINHAEDKVICVDLTFAKPIVSLLSKLPTLKAVIIMCDKASMPHFDAPNVLCYEDVIASEKESFDWPTIDERQACSLCYTSGTTGLQHSTSRLSAPSGATGARGEGAWARVKRRAFGPGASRAPQGSDQGLASPFPPLFFHFFLDRTSADVRFQKNPQGGPELPLATRSRSNSGDFGVAAVRRTVRRSCHVAVGPIDILDLSSG